VTIKHRALLALILGAALIGCSPLFVRWSETGPVATAFYRIFLALPVLVFFLRWTERKRPNDAILPTVSRDRWLLVIAGVMFACDLSVWHWSIVLTSVANATLFANLAPLFVTVGACWLFKESIARSFWFALALGLTGMTLMFADSAHLSPRYLVGDSLGVLTAVFYGGYILAVSRARQRVSTARIMVWSGAITAIILLPVAVLTGEQLLPHTANGWLILLGVALISQAAGQTLIAYALAHLPAAFSSLTLLVQPIVAMLLAWVLLDEAMDAQQMSGAVLVLSAILLARRKVS